MVKRLTLIAVLLLLVTTAQATNYYISAGSGNDANYGTSPGTPWKHAYMGCNAAIAGDTVFLAGSFPPESTLYNASFGYCTLYPQNSGISGSPIVYKNWPDSGRPLIYGYINTCYTSPDCFQTTIVNSGTNYIVFDSLETKWGYRGIHISSGSHITVQYCLSYLNTGGNNNNYGNIYIGPGVPSYVTIRGNILHDAMESLGSPYTTGGFNTGGVYAEVEGWDVAGVSYETVNPSLYGSHIIVEDNTIYSQGGWGIRLKRMVDSAIVRNNTIYGCTQGMAMAGAGVFDQVNYGNIIYDCGLGMVVMGANNTLYVPSEGIQTFNNTIYNNSSGGWAIWAGSKLAKANSFNNIYDNCNSYIQASSAPLVPESLWFDYNDAYSCTGAGYFALLATSYASLAAWQSNSISYVITKDPNSITSDPLFTNIASEDVTLQVGSPCLTIYKDTTFTLWTGEEITVDGMGAFNVYTDGVARDSTTYTPTESVNDNRHFKGWGKP